MSEHWVAAKRILVLVIGILESRATPIKKWIWVSDVDQIWARGEGGFLLGLMCPRLSY